MSKNDKRTEYADWKKSNKMKKNKRVEDWMDELEEEWEEDNGYEVKKRKKKE